MKLLRCTRIHHQRFSNITRAKPQAIVHCHLGKLNITKQNLIYSLIVIFLGQGEQMKKFNCKEGKKKGKTHHQGKWRMQSHVQPKNHYSRIVSCINSLWGCPQSDFLVFIHASIRGVPHSNFFLQNKPFHWPTTNISRTWITPQQYENLNLFPSPK